MEHGGTLVISLDFELNWGVRDRIGLDAYAERLLGVRTAVPAMLELFARYGVHATWATVGLLFFRSKQELLQSVPEHLPAYCNPRLSPYPTLAEIGEDERSDPFHYAPSLIEMILSSPHQYIGTHTFSHYYSLAKGQDATAFAADLAAAVDIASKWGLSLSSLVFPRNQVQPTYLSLLRQTGIFCYRGNPRSWLHQPAGDRIELRWKRFLRLIDNYVNLSGHHYCSWEEMRTEEPFNVRASRFLRPYSRRLRWLEALRCRRILAGMTKAAKAGQVYHLWWHPHNFGADVAENLRVLQKILAHYQRLQERYGMQSLSMEEVATRLREGV